MLFGKPVKVLAIFEPGANPIPVKFKSPEPGEENVTVRVDEAICNDIALSFISYDCVSHYETYSKKYQLIYDKEKCEWQLKLK